MTAGFPLREVEPMDCIPCSGRGEFRTKGIDDIPNIKKCEACNGRGTVPPFGPYGTLIRKKSNMLQGGDKSQEKDMVKYISPSVDILTFGSKTWRDYKADLEKELNQLFIEDAQSAVAKDVDREGKVAKLDTIGYHLFMVLMKHTILDIAQLMSISLKESAIDISLPPTFVVRSEEDLTTEMAKLKESNAPFQVDGQVWLEYIKKRFPGNSTLSRSMMMLAEYDPLFGMSDEDIVAARNGGVIDDVMVRQHTLGFAAIKRLVWQEGVAVLEAENIFERIDAMIEQLMPLARIETNDDEPLQ